MIAANELRIGNWVRLFKGVDDNGDVWKDYEISGGFDLYKLDENDCADIKPIPLDESWLIRAAFNPSERGTYFTGKYVDVNKYNSKLLVAKNIYVFRLKKEKNKRLYILFNSNFTIILI